MWIRYRKNYSDTGAWCRWHETLGTGDRAPTRCGIRHYPHHRIEAKEERPRHGTCGNCDRFRRKEQKRQAAR